MSSLTSNPSPPPAFGSTPPDAAVPARGGPTPRGRRSRARPGVSLLAQGEVWVWLTGSALLMALLMISGLLGLIVWQGSLTFWPVPVVRAQLKDGAHVMGEVSREEQFGLSADALDRLSSESQEAARAFLAGRPTATARRRLFRTGNFELTQTHYRWVSDFEIQPNSEEQPEWAVAVERLEWGRFFGFPQALVERFPRTSGLEEDDLSVLVRLLTDHANSLPDEQQLAARQWLQRLEKERTTLRAENTRRFAEVTQADPPTTSASESSSLPRSTARWLAVLSDGTTVPLAEVTAESEVVELQALWESPETVWAGFLAHHAAARQTWRERQGLERDALGTLNHDIEEARLSVRKQELREQVAVLDSVEELSTLRTELAAQQSELDDVAHRLERHARRRAELAPLLDLGKSILASQRASLEVQSREQRERVGEIERQLERLPDRVATSVRHYLDIVTQANQRGMSTRHRIAQLTAAEQNRQVRLVAVDNQEVSLPLSHVVRAYRANQLTTSERWRLYASRWWEFLTDEPREANSEGGIWPAIVGTVCMTLVMSLAVVPFGVLAALYLREYARRGWIVSVVRIAINNLAGVPSIVFGAFGFGFFCYLVGAFLDGGPTNVGIQPWPPFRWYAGLGCVAMVAVGGFVSGLLSMTFGERRKWSAWVGRLSVLLWIAATGLLAWLLFVSPYFGGLNAARLPNPTFGKGGLLWSSLTLALMTLPVVIVATEEALSAVPNSLREGSYACGAGKWQTIRRIVLPQAMPGILTGMILAMARGAGEVAPLMLVGAVKLAPELPVDLAFPFVHSERSFMHLGFHIYDLGFQSQNSEAAKPMVFTTTMLLILMIFFLNVVAIWLRSRLRRRFRMSQF